MATLTSQYVKTVNNTTPHDRVGVFRFLAYSTASVQDMLAHSRWNPLQSLAKSTIISRLGHLKRRQLTIESAGEVYEFGKPFTLQSEGPPHALKAKIVVTDEKFWARVFLHADFGFADSYMLKEIEIESLNSAFRIFVLNRKSLSEMHTWASPLIRTASYIANLGLANGIGGSKSNISAHYDLPYEVFAGILSWDMTYSCAIFDEEAGRAAGDLIQSRPVAPPRNHYSDTRALPPDDLERGQLEKLHLIIRKARIKEGSCVLEIGCGWGSFAILAAGTYGAIVDTLTISEEQKVSVDESICAAGLSHQIKVHVLDYRDMPRTFEHAFDAVVSIGVMEHIGIKFMPGWFKKMAWAMKAENSVKVFTMSTVPNTRWHQYATEVDFIRKYIYPGGQLSSVKTLVDAITAGGLNVESIENIGPHYARTLREWGRRFQQNFPSYIKPALQKLHPDLTEDEIEIFRRKWTYYFAYSEAGFAMRSISDSVVVATREANLNI